MNLNNLVAVSCFIFHVFSVDWSVRALRSRAVNSLVSCPMFELPQYVSSVGETVIDQIRYCKLNIYIYIYTTIYSPTEWFANVFRSVPFAVPLFNSRNLIKLPLEAFHISQAAVVTCCRWIRRMLFTMSWMGHSAWLNEVAPVAPYTVYTGTGVCCSFLRNDIATQLWRFFSRSSRSWCLSPAQRHGFVHGPFWLLRSPCGNLSWQNTENLVLHSFDGNIHSKRPKNEETSQNMDVLLPG